MGDILYANPPLIEVICEVHWELQQIRSLPPEARFDPHFETFKDDIANRAAEAGFSFVEQLQNSIIPREFRPHAPEVRFRRGQGEWPLFQIGPGLFVVNTVPPYGGWDNFRADVRKFINFLLICYPVSSRYLKISRLELRYVNAFDNKFGFTSYSSFVAQNLRVITKVPSDLLAKHMPAGRDVDVHSRIDFPIISPANSVASINIGTGLIKEAVAALLLNLIVREDRGKPHSLELTEIVDWFDQAHESIRDLFDHVFTAELKKKMVPIGEA